MQILEGKWGLRPREQEEKMKLFMEEVSIHLTTQPFNTHLWTPSVYQTCARHSVCSSDQDKQGHTLGRSPLCEAHIPVKVTRD